MAQTPKNKLAENPPRGVEKVGERNDWYRDRYHTVLRNQAITLLLAGVMGVAIVVLVITRPEPKYFALDPETGSVVQMVPLNQPLLSSNALTQWAERRASEAFTLNFVDYQQRLEHLRDFFTGSTFDSFLEQMETSGNLDALREGRLVMEATASPARITTAGVAKNGRYSWRVEVPIRITTYVGTDNTRAQTLTVEMDVVRVDTRLRPESGVVISRFLTRIG